MLKKSSHLKSFAAFLAIIAVSGPVLAQQRPAEPPKKLTLKTDDGVDLAVTYYPSTLGKKAVPVVMLADHETAQSVFAPFALRLQSPSQDENDPSNPPDTHESFAVITVDLRGHGDSLRQRLPKGSIRELEAGKLTRQDLNAMVAFDMKAVRKFLVDENDAGKLNLNALSLVGAGMGAAVAINWAAFDWAVPPLPIGKQGQDVKALVLVSPAWKFRGLTVQKALQQPGLRNEVAVLMLYGEQDKSVTADVNRIYDMLVKYHPVPESVAPGEVHDLMKLGANVKVQGTQLLKNRAAENRIIQFLQVHVVDENFPWSKRRNE
jgi:hypothetical protein